MSIRISSLAFLIALSVSLPAPPCFAQSQEDKRPKLKDFGSSVKRLKWDPVQRTEVKTVVYRRDDTFRSRVPLKSRFGKSDQYSALLATLKEAFRPEDLRPIIVFQTDGDEAFFLRDSALRITAPPD